MGDMARGLPNKKRRPGRALLRLALFPLGLAAYLLILLEEWLWDRGAAAMAALGKLPLVARGERALAGAPPALAACAFILPGAALLPFKLAGLFLISHGHAALGLCVFVLAKFVGAATVARVWTLTEPSLRKIAWISKSVDWVVGKKNAVKAWIHSLWAVRMGKAMVARMRSGARGVRARLAAKLWARARAKARARRQANGA